MFVCYAADHAGDCYAMFDPRVQSTLKSRDVLWLNRMYFPNRDGQGAPIVTEASNLLMREVMIINQQKLRSKTNPTMIRMMKQKMTTNQIVTKLKMMKSPKIIVMMKTTTMEMMIVISRPKEFELEQEE